MMKKIIVLLLVVLCSSNAAMSGERRDEVAVVSPGWENAKAATVCLDGMVFAVAAMGGAGANGNAVSIVQVYVEKDGKVVPKKCKE